jgi:CBS domain-containing protein
MSLNVDVGSCSVAEVMGTEMFTLTPETAVSSARRLALENDVHHMLVLDKGTLAGIVCRDDLRFADRNGRIGDCMTSPVLCIPPETTLQEAVDIMGANDIDCLPVVTGAFLVGIVTLEALATADLFPGQEWDFSRTDDLEDSDDSGDVRRASCDVCRSTGAVSDPEATGKISLCVRCHRVYSSNQRC